MGNIAKPTSVKTTKLGSEILKYAESWLAKYCVEETKNYSPCLADLKNLYSSKFGKTWAYCASTTTVIVEQATGEISPLRSASAIGVVNHARKKGIRIDKIPQAGCIFYKTGAEGSTGHVGFVWGVDGENFWSIEGNASGYAWKDGKFTETRIEGIVVKYRSISSIRHFIHIEELEDTRLITHRTFLNNMNISGGWVLGILGVSILATKIYNNYNEGK